MQTFFSIVKSFISLADLSRFACFFVPGLAKKADLMASLSYY